MSTAQTRAASRSASTGVVNIRPGVGIIGLFPHMNYKPWFALGELVDNALASYLANRSRLDAADGGHELRIVIEASGADGGRIRVWDNAAGISAADYQRAFVAAEPPADTTGLSQFGIGMKSASCWFARRWRVRTSALGEAVERTIEFDVPRIVEDGIEQLTANERPAPEGVHFTEIELWDLHKPPHPRTLAKMEDHLASIYRVFTTRGDVSITFNDRDLTFEQPRVLVARLYSDPTGEEVEWYKDISFQLDTGESVTGFAAIRDTASVAKAGFALFRHDRLIVGSDEETYRPHEIFGASNRFRYQRVFGELHLDGFDVSHTKDGFIWGDQEGAFLERLRRELDAEPIPLLRQAENYRSRVPTPAQQHAGARALDGTAHAVGRSGPVLEQQVTSAPGPDDLPARHQPAADTRSRTLEVAVHGQPWEITIELTSDPAVSDWVSIATDASPASERPRTLGIRVSLAHPFMLRFGGPTPDDLEPLLRVAAALALGEVTAREAGLTRAGAIRRNVNELLRGSLSEP